MLRPHVHEAYKWIILWFILALLLLIAESMLLPQPAIALVSQMREVTSALLFQIFQ